MSTRTAMQTPSSRLLLAHAARLLFLLLASALAAACAEPVQPLQSSDARDTDAGDLAGSDTSAGDTPDTADSGDSTDAVLPPPPFCANGQHDGDELALDCGGSCPRGCAIGEACYVSADCASKRCVGGRCQGLGCQLDLDCPGDVPWCAAGNCVACTLASHCDDGNPCTDDRCDLNQCFNDVRSGPCDDGFFCNGDETCVGGQCTASGALPCGASMPCNEATRSCDECAGDTDCGAPSQGPWSNCQGFGGDCGEQGVRSRLVTTPRCTGGRCVNEVTELTAGCNRDTEGQDCGAPQVGAWDRACDGGCGSFERSRSIETPTCSAGQCTPIQSFQTETCEGLGEGSVCGDDGSYCGTPMSCRVCRGTSCEINTPHFGTGCLPSCGVAGDLCGLPGVCCSQSAFCSQGLVGPTWDCEKCCVGSCN